jgi:Acetyltransferase (GNAT) domain
VTQTDSSAAGHGGTAELLADGGEAAAGEEFFRSRPFFDAEGVTHTLRISATAGDLLAPLIVREIPAGRALDATSPYGYPGLAAPPGLRLDPAGIDFSPTGLVSAFIRHAVGEPPLLGASERNVVQIADPGLAPKSRMSDRQQIRRNLRRGYRVTLTPGGETTSAERSGFLAAYEETMRRAAAAERYFFASDYFDRILESPRAWLALARGPGGEIAAGSVAVQSDGFLHYYLSGTAGAHLRESPMKNLVSALIEFATELGLPLNLGGGISRGDRLEEFKRGFANRQEPWRSSEIVCDAGAYARLSAGLDAGSFFPAYRAGG